MVIFRSLKAEEIGVCRYPVNHNIDIALVMVTSAYACLEKTLRAPNNCERLRWVVIGTGMVGWGIFNYYLNNELHRQCLINAIG